MRIQTLFTVALGSLLAFAPPACLDPDRGEEIASAPGAQGSKDPFSTPSIDDTAATETTITIEVCAGDTGAPAGFSLQWKTKESHAATGWSSETLDDCAASFSGTPAGSIFSLKAGECVFVTAGALEPELGLSFQDGCNDGLVCGTEYAFRAFAHGDAAHGRSEFTPTLIASTAACDAGCTYPHGHWKSGVGWPVSSLMLGTRLYTQAELASILNQPVMGNGCVSLAYQLITAKLNIANGADPTDAGAAIAAADALIGNLVVPPIVPGTCSKPPSATNPLKNLLEAYNTGVTGPGLCE